ncbi:MerR family DNA-binding protein [Paracoccus sp. PAMC 22219]|uniref:MerR family DNA-binding protein n=1 Tax=Paracoccus sp. PAMC 22219 TaxID=1569209 RepID=UPI0027D7C0FD|nr:MerR family DNA-binding protein [Paracoccus sp. PAMC 22219]
MTTIRFYEGRGLLPDPGRTGGGQRRYGDAELDRLSFIAHARQLGFNLDAIAELIALQETPQTAHGDAQRIAKDRISDIRDRIERLRRLEMELMRVVNACDGRSDGQPCRVLHALADHQTCEGEH